MRKALSRFWPTLLQAPQINRRNLFALDTTLALQIKQAGQKSVKLFKNNFCSFILVPQALI